MSYVTLSISPSGARTIDVTGKKDSIADCWKDSYTVSWTLTATWNIEEELFNKYTDWTVTIGYYAPAIEWKTETFPITSRTGSKSITISFTFPVESRFLGREQWGGSAQAWVYSPRWGNRISSSWVSYSVTPVAQYLSYPTLRMEVTIEGGSGKILPGTSISIPWDKGVTIQVIPDPGYAFRYWEGSIPGGHRDENPITTPSGSYYWYYYGECKLLTTPLHLKAVLVSVPPESIDFYVEPEYSGTLTVVRSDGTVLGSTNRIGRVTVPHNTQVYFKAEPASGYQLDRITVDGRTYTSSPTPTITVTGSLAAWAYFKRSTVKVTLNVNPSGSGNLKKRIESRPIFTYINLLRPFPESQKEN